MDTVNKILKKAGVFFKRLKERIVSFFARLPERLREGKDHRGDNSGEKAGTSGGIAEKLRSAKPAVLAAIAAGIVLLAAVPIIAVSVAGGQSDASSKMPAEEALVDIDLGTPAVSHGAIMGTSEATPIPTPEPILITKGNRSDIIPDVQLRLMGLYYMDADDPTDLFGEMTSDAIVMFQRRHGLNVTGVLDQVTYDTLMSGDAKVYMVTVGDDGTDIKELQHRLYEMGYIESVTGYFGTDTEAAVKKFQENNKLSTDGKIGPATREMLYSENAKPNFLSYGAQSEQVKQYQEILKRLGYLTTEPDGYYGSDTIAAVKRFQERNSLIADGYIGPTTRKKLQSSDAQANALMVGMSGDDVMNVQKLLKKHGYLNSGCCTGYYGSTTEYAVRHFQKRNNLSCDGKVGRQTMKVLTSDHPTGPSASYVIGGGGGGGGYTNPGATVERFIEVAKSKLGCRYVRGAKGPDTFDCSGFVYWCLNQSGVSQGYMTSISWRTCTKYRRLHSMSDIKKGDVIVFKMSSNSGHVGIALSSSRMIDASSRFGKVVERSFKTDYWRSVFYCAYRIFE